MKNIFLNEQKVGMLLYKETDTFIHTLNFAQVKSMDDNCGVGGMYGCG